MSSLVFGVKMGTFRLQLLKIGLLLIWLCGFILISISFYATTQILPASYIKEQIKNLTNSVGPTVTIFAAAKPFVGSVGSKQSLAIRSWLGLSQDISVVLFGQDPYVFAFAASFGLDSRVSVEPNIDYTFLGTPFFHSMVTRAQTSNSDISVLMDPETILLPDFIATLNHVHNLDHDWLLVASPRNISDFPFQLDVDGKHWLGDKGEKIKTKKGLPVFRARSAPSNISYDDCHFGTNCFQRVTKVKSRVVLEILKLGYNVLMSDVDVYWFKNPLPMLTTFGPAVFVAQSDEYKLTGPINLPRRLNSGFYYAHSDSTTIAALEMVVKHASLSNLSEQPSFYDTLCGLNGSYRLDDDTCQEPITNLTIRFLDRNLFPNGAYRELWDSSNVSSTCSSIGCFVLHNNWISGRQKKLERQVSSGLWEYDISTRMCLLSWQRLKPISYF